MNDPVSGRLSGTPSSTLTTGFFRSATVLRLALIGVALVMLGLYVSHRSSIMSRRKAEISGSLDQPGRRRDSPVTPWEFMARMEGRAFLGRNLGKLRYPGGVLMDNPPHTIELYVSVKDRPEVVAEYYAKQCGIKLSKSKVTGSVRYSAHTKLQGSELIITVNPAQEGAIIIFGLTDMKGPR